MSDSDSDDLSDGRAANSAARLSDFPLAPTAESASAAFAALRREFEALTQEILASEARDQLSEARDQLTRTVSDPFGSNTLSFSISAPPWVQPRLGSASTGHTDLDSLPMALPTAMSLPTAEPKKPVVTFVSALALTPYNESKEANGKARTIAYVKVQRSVLEYLETKASDSLSIKQARHWTRSIGATGNKAPTVKDALRLCYYMRSQGFDVYARFEKKNMLLYIVKQTSHDRGKDHDTLYWSQNFNTNVIKGFRDIEAAQYARRNAISNSLDGLIPTTSSRADPSQLARQRAQALVEDRELRAADRADALRLARARLQLELDRENPDPE